MASKIKADQFETLDGSGNITLNNSVTMASTKTLPAASLTGTLPAISGVNLTALNATNLGSGTVPTARLGSGTANTSVFLRGDGSWQTAGSTSASDLTSGTVATARLGSGTASSSTFLRGDGSWQAAGSPSITDSGDATAMTITSTEQILIGNATALALQGSPASESKMQIVGTGGGLTRVNIGAGGVSAYPQLRINAASTNSAIAGELSFSKTHDNTLTTLADVVQGERLGAINFSGVSRSDASYNSGAYIRAFVSSTGTVSSTYVPTDLWFGTQATSTDRTNSPQLKIMSDGRVISQSTAKAWAKFNGSGTPSFDDSYNCSSISDGGTGYYYVNFTNNLANANYAKFVDTYDSNHNSTLIVAHSTTNFSTSSMQVICQTTTGSAADEPHLNILCFGD